MAQGKDHAWCRCRDEQEALARYAGGKTKEEKRSDKRKRKYINRESKQYAQYVLAGSGVIFLLIIVIVWYWSTRPLPTKDI